MLEVLRINICSPLSLAFVLGIVSRLVCGELLIPCELYASLSIYLLLALGLKGARFPFELHREPDKVRERYGIVRSRN